MTAQVLELVAQHPRADEGLHPHVARAHLDVLFAAVVGPEVLLDEDSGGAHLEETASK